jgi:hypothetical protein
MEVSRSGLPVRSLGLDFLAQLRFQVVDDRVFQVFPFHLALFGWGWWVEGVVGFLDLTDLTGGDSAPELVEAGREVTRFVACPGPDGPTDAVAGSGIGVPALPGHTLRGVQLGVQQVQPELYVDLLPAVENVLAS